MGDLTAGVAGFGEEGADGPRLTDDAWGLQPCFLATCSHAYPLATDESEQFCPGPKHVRPQASRAQIMTPK